MIAPSSVNPSDYKMGATFPTEGAVVGMDFAGTIASIHPDTRTDLRIGDRVCGGVHGSNPSDPHNGAFAQYVRTRPELLLRVPYHLSMEQTATLGTGIMTNILALWDPLALGLQASPEHPAEKPLPVLVYGASTATGSLAIQMLRLSGLQPIVTCSPRNFALVQERGAGGKVDYMQPDAVEEVKGLTGGKLKHAYDCIVDTVSVSHCYKAIGRTGGRYVALEMVPDELRVRRAVRAKVVLGYEAFGRDVALSKGYESSGDPKKFDLVVKYFRILQKYLDDGTLRTHPIQTLEGGFEGILQGLQVLQSGSISGKKLVAIIDR